MKVICVNANKLEHLTENKEYEVKDDYSKSMTYSIQDDSGEMRYYFKYKFRRLDNE